jgi:hypothetical protein
LRVSPWVWALTLLGILTIIAVDLFIIHRDDTKAVSGPPTAGK